MKIVAANIYVAQTGNRRAVVLELETDVGIRGIGEVGIAYGVGTEAAAAMTHEMVSRFLIGQDPARIEFIWNTIYDGSFWTRGGGAISIAALSGIDQALWDIKGRALNVPVYDLLGGAIVDRLPVYANGWWMGCETDDDYACAAAAMVARGYTRLKFYPLGEFDPRTVIRHPFLRTAPVDIGVRIHDRIARIRDRVGDGVEIMLDFGGGLTTDQLLRILPRLETLDILFIEEPVEPALPGALSRLSERTGIVFSAGERVYTRYGFHTLLETGAVSIVQPDVCNTGGLSEARKIAALAEIYNARVAPHNYGSTLATVTAAHLATCIPNFMVLECFPDYAHESEYHPVISTPLEDHISEGYMPIPEGPGLGAELDKTMRASCCWARVNC